MAPDLGRRPRDCGRRRVRGGVRRSWPPGPEGRRHLPDPGARPLDQGAGLAAARPTWQRPRPWAIEGGERGGGRPSTAPRVDPPRDLRQRGPRRVASAPGTRARSARSEPQRPRTRTRRSARPPPRSPPCSPSPPSRRAPRRAEAGRGQGRTPLSPWGWCDAIRHSSAAPPHETRMQTAAGIFLDRRLPCNLGWAGTFRKS